MKHEPIGRRRATNVSLPEAVVERARAAKVNISQSCAAGLIAAVELAEEQLWKADHADWIAAHCKWVEANELPLERYRLF